eukprot:TRINITY_DN11736_c0_g1_i4.p1 TRINITY_DN11736_c0_g1~~TRINITY_DN11736_c0_g1_i4.p1  ORF type:complete len:242 (+),score=58.47 TRINITY_DN11736_c0_g1_i4:187-912(+)
MALYSGSTFGSARDHFGARATLGADPLTAGEGRDAWRIELTAAIPSAEKLRECGCDPDLIARTMQDSCHEQPEDVAYALRALEVARHHPQLALQAVKLMQLVAFKFPHERVHTTRQVLGSLLATMEIHAEEEFIASACCSTLKFLTDGTCDGRDRAEWPGEEASPCSPTNRSQRFELTPARMLHEAGAEAIIQRVVAINAHNEYLVDAGNRAISNIRFGTCLLYTSPSPRDRTRSRMPSSA